MQKNHNKVQVVVHSVFTEKEVTMVNITVDEVHENWVSKSYHELAKRFKMNVNYVRSLYTVDIVNNKHS